MFTNSSGRSHGLMALGLLILAALVILGMMPSQPASLQAIESNPVQPVPRDMLCSLEDSFSEIASRVGPGVVSITALHQSPVRSDETNGLDEFFERFFEGGLVFPDGLILPHDLHKTQAQTRPVRATGSGTIVKRDGANFYVLTNYHVVEGAYRVNVRLSDGTALPGTVMGTDSVTDLAVVRISSSRLSEKNIVPMGDSDTVKVGNWALAVGNPFGFEHTLTVGVVSALQRELEEEDTIYPDLIQTDAAINRGNSGGPLLDVEGRVIGVNAAIASPTGGFVGLGFAIPINTAKEVVDQLITEGRVVRGWLGLGIQELTPILQEYYGIERGVLIASINKDGPAMGSGLAEEDVIVKVGDDEIREIVQLQRVIAGTSPGTTIPLTVVREGTTHVFRLRIGESPSTPQGRPAARPPRDGSGIRVATLTAELASRMGMGGLKGVVVLEVTAGSPAEEGGLEQGDIISAVNKRHVASEPDFANTLAHIRPGTAVVLKVLRDKSPRIVGFRME